MGERLWLGFTTTLGKVPITCNSVTYPVYTLVTSRHVTGIGIQVTHPSLHWKPEAEQ